MTNNQISSILGEWLRQPILELPVIFNLARGADPLRDWPPSDEVIPRWRSLKAAIRTGQLKATRRGEPANIYTLIASKDLAAFLGRTPGSEWDSLRAFSAQWTEIHGEEAALSTADKEGLCERWLRDLMKEAGGPSIAKDDYFEQARNTHGIGRRAFNRAWDSAIKNSGNREWSKPGPNPVGNRDTDSIRQLIVTLI